MALVKHLLLILVVLVAGGCQSSNTVTLGDPTQNTELARSYNDLAYTHIQKGEYDKARTLLEQALNADITFGPAHNNLGLVYFQLDDLYRAAHEFDSAIKLMPYQPDARNNLGMVFERFGERTRSQEAFKKAVDAYERARKLSPDNPLYLGNLTRVKINRGDRDEETRALLEELVFKDPRPEWRDWARMELLKMGTRIPLPAGSATQPVNKGKTQG